MSFPYPRVPTAIELRIGGNPGNKAETPCGLTPIYSFNLFSIFN